jgi:hypothetical protein
MLDFELFEISTDLFLLITSVLIFLLQTLLCFKVKSLFFRLLPAIFLFPLALIFFILVFVFDGWDSVGFLLLSIWTAILLGASGLSWALWAIIRGVKRRKGDERL